METIIANKRYDTDQAKSLGNWQRGYSSDKGHISETLYVTASGDYFLYGQGGPRSRYAQRVAPNTWGYGERILPMTVEEAHAWAENHLTEAAHDTAFRPEGDSGNLTSITLKLRTSTVEKLQQLADERGIEPSELADTLLKERLA